MEYCIAHEADARDEILTFLFQLSYCRVGLAYPAAALTPAQRTLLGKFADLGLIYATGPRFYPTAVAVNLIFGTALHHPPQQQQQQQQQRAAGGGGGGGARGPGARAGGGAQGQGQIRLVDPNQLAVIVETNYQVRRRPLGQFRGKGEKTHVSGTEQHTH